MKRLIPLLCFSLFTLTAFSQAHLAFKIGGNFDYLESVRGNKSLDKAPPFKFVGGHFGMAMDIPLYEDIISFSPELLFLGKALVGEEGDVVFGDIQIPLLFSCYITTTFGVDLGPVGSYQILNFAKNGDEWVKGEAELEKFDFGIAGGVRFKLNDNAMILARYNFGLRKLFDVTSPLLDYGIYNRSIQIGYIYSGGRGY